MSSTYFIVGATSGIGQELANQLADQGYDLVSISRSEDADPPLDTHYSVDILDQNPEWPSFDDSIEGIAYCPGSINLKPFPSLKLDDFRNDWEINVEGFIKTLKQYRKNLKKADQASVVAFSTVAVQQGMAFHSSVSASKGAIEGIVRSLASEWAPDIRVNAVAPSLTDTPMARSLLSNEKRRKKSEQRHPLKRIGTTEDIAHAAKYLLTDQSSWVTGQIMHVDGGLSSLD